METVIHNGNDWEVRSGPWQSSPLDSVDVVISDPPYDSRTHNNDMAMAPVKNTFNGASRFINSRRIDFEPLEDPGSMARVMLETARRWVLCFCSIEMVGTYAKAAGPDQWIRGGVWVKTDPVPQISGDRPAVFGDALAIMHRKGRKVWNGHGSPAVWIYGIERKDRCHPTQKPLGLMLALVRLFSNPGELIWDPYMGSGTTGIAALRLGRRFVGHEINPEYSAVAAERLAAEEKGLTLQDSRWGQMSILDAMDKR